MPSFAIWIVPDDKTASTLTDIIREQASRHGTNTFDPHLTLFGEIIGGKQDILEKTDSLAKKTTSFPITLEPIEISTTYYQCVFARVQTTAPLMNMHLLAQSIFGEPSKEPYTPHISLVYGTMPMETREHIAQSIRLPPLSFTAETIWVMQKGKDGWESGEKVEELSIKHL